MNSEGKKRANYVYDKRINYLLGNPKDYRIFIDNFGDVVIKYNDSRALTLSEHREDLNFFKELVK